MVLELFLPPRAPSPGTSEKPEIKLLRAEFGDGYTQTTRDGLNHRRRVLSLTWENLTALEAREILAFLERQGGDTPFFYRPSQEAAAVAFTCEEWEERHAGAGLRSVNATFRQFFGPVS